jgi:hypothetical protein
VRGLTITAVVAIIWLAVGASVPSASRLAAAAATPTSAGNWQIDPAHTGSQPLEALTPPLVKKWSVDLGGRPGFVSYPVIANNRVYVTFIHPASTRLIALNLATGTIAWGPIDLGGGYNRADLAYDNGRVFVSNGSGEGMAFDAVTGARLWLGGGYGLPVPFNGIVYLSGSDEATGRGVWSAHPAATYPPMPPAGPPAVTSSGVYFANVCGPVWGFDPVDGHELWHSSQDCSGTEPTIPNVYGGKVYVDHNGTLLVLDASTGSTVGTFALAAQRAFDGQQGFFLEGPYPLTLTRQAACRARRTPHLVICRGRRARQQSDRGQRDRIRRLAVRSPVWRERDHRRTGLVGCGRPRRLPYAELLRARIALDRTECRAGDVARTDPEHIGCVRDGTGHLGPLPQFAKHARAPRGRREIDAASSS